MKVGRHAQLCVRRHLRAARGRQPRPPPRRKREVVHPREGARRMVVHVGISGGQTRRRGGSADGGSRGGGREARLRLAISHISHKDVWMQGFGYPQKKPAVKPARLGSGQVAGQITATPC